MLSIGGLLVLPVSPRTAWAWEREYIEMVKFNANGMAGDNYFVWLRCWKLRLLKGVWLISLYVLLKYPLKPRIFFPFQSQDLTIKNPKLSRPEAQRGPWCCAWGLCKMPSAFCWRQTSRSVGEMALTEAHECISASPVVLPLLRGCPPHVEWKPKSLQWPTTLYLLCPPLLLLTATPIPFPLAHPAPATELFAVLKCTNKLLPPTFVPSVPST